MLFKKKVKILIKFGPRLADSLTLESTDTRVDGDETNFVITGKFLPKEQTDAEETN